MSVERIQPSVAALDMVCVEAPAPPTAMMLFGASGDLREDVLCPRGLRRSRHVRTHQTAGDGAAGQARHPRVQSVLSGGAASPLRDDCRASRLRRAVPPGGTPAPTPGPAPLS